MTILLGNNFIFIPQFICEMEHPLDQSVKALFVEFQGITHGMPLV